MNEIVPLDEPGGMGSKDDTTGSSEKLTITSYFYEWNSATKQWGKINPDDPEPPPALPPGKFDGHVVEIKH